MSSEKIKRYDGPIDPMDPYGTTWKFCRPEDVEALEEAIKDLKRDRTLYIEALNMTESRLSQITEERDRAISFMKELAFDYWKDADSFSVTDWTKRARAFLSSLTKEKE